MPTNEQRDYMNLVFGVKTEQQPDTQGTGDRASADGSHGGENTDGPGHRVLDRLSRDGDENTNPTGGGPTPPSSNLLGAPPIAKPKGKDEDPKSTEDKPDGKNQTEEKSNGKEGEKGEGDIDSVLKVLEYIDTITNEVKLKAAVADVLVKNKNPDDISWSGPTIKSVKVDKITSLLARQTIVEADIEVYWYYDGKFIHNLSARISRANIESISSSLEIDFTVTMSSTHGAGGIAVVDWELRFNYSHMKQKQTITVTGTAKGDGSGTSSKSNISFED